MPALHSLCLPPIPPGSLQIWLVVEGAANTLVDVVALLGLHQDK